MSLYGLVIKTELSQCGTKLRYTLFFFNFDNAKI